ncbi:uncharacterized protein LOC121855146 [Homarus americanus]|uniref:uncharacterized protein LOC121855146 n=1 Tax=Homarus americanus TaxID=6706 RepID=UPI001C45EA04|nr:uncharacterized protein LOC121855146 [Homarus americanus]
MENKQKNKKDRILLKRIRFQDICFVLTFIVTLIPMVQAHDTTDPSMTFNHPQAPEEVTGHGYYPHHDLVDEELESDGGSDTITSTSANKQTVTLFDTVKNKLIEHVDTQGRSLSRQMSSLNFPSLEVALLSLAFLTFAVFLIDLVQDLLNGNTSGRKRRDAADDGLTDLIVLTLSSLDTVSFGRENPECGQRLLCHLNRSGWHDGMLGTASNYFVSMILSLFSPSSGFQGNLDAANYGRESEECAERYPTCPSVLGDLLPSTR